MTESSNDSGATDVSDESLTRDDVLTLLSGALVESARKAENGRVRDAENEKVRQGWFRTVARLAGEHRKVLADRDDLAELRERVEDLENDSNDDNPYRFK